MHYLDAHAFNVVHETFVLELVFGPVAVDGDHEISVLLHFEVQAFDAADLEEGSCGDFVGFEKIFALQLIEELDLF